MTNAEYVSVLQGFQKMTGVQAQPQSTDIESLEQMLEPERTGVHSKSDRPPWALIIVIMLLLAAGAAVAVVLAMQQQ